jgi:hypothetical protein
MAAWFAMLVLIVSVLLTAAAKISRPEWAAGYLVIFASAVILLVIGCVTLMLTKFRPHLQEGKEYAQWLKDQNMYSAGGVVMEVKHSAPTPHLNRNERGLRARRTRTGRFLISVAYIPGAINLVESLKNAAFTAEVYKVGLANKTYERPEDHEAIWVGSRVNSGRAIEAIKIAVSLWPHLKYVHLSGDNGDPPDYVHDQIFFGGATSTARSYGLQPWSRDELLGLHESMTDEGFHGAIRAKYSQ